MFERIFTYQQLSLFFHIAVLINIISLFFDLIIYHYFPDNSILELLAANVNNVSISMVILTIISQAILIFIEHYHDIVSRYKIVAATLLAAVSIFFIWLFTIENDIQGKTIIFLSSLSVFDHSYKLSLTLIAIFIFLVFDFIKTLYNPIAISTQSVPAIIRSTFHIVTRRHLIIFLFVFGIIHFKSIHKFAIALLHHSESSLLYDLTFLEIIVPIVWIGALLYYSYKFYYSRHTIFISSWRKS